MADHDDQNPFHLPPPSALPIVVGFGVALLLFGFVPDARIWRLTLVSIGATITVAGILIWVRDAMQEYRNLPD